MSSVGGDAVLKLAEQALQRGRSSAELEGVLHAAVSDYWPELAPAIARRFEREIDRAGSSSPRRYPALFDSFALAMETLDAPLSTKAIRTLLNHANARLRALGARLAGSLWRSELATDLLPHCWERSSARGLSCEAIGNMGEALHAAALWPHALSAHRLNQPALLNDLLTALGGMGAFDIQLPLRVWIEEEIARRGDSADVWRFGQIWSRLVDAKHASGACSNGEALEDLHWFVRNAGAASLEHASSSVHGVFSVAHQLAIRGERAGADDLLIRFADWGLPPPVRYPGLLSVTLRDWVLTHKPTERAWLAAAGHLAAQEELLEAWETELRNGAVPERWSLRRFLPAERVAGILRSVLQEQSAPALRQTLGLLLYGQAAHLVEEQIDALAKSHASAVVRWKAARVLSTLRAEPPVSEGASKARWVRLDAALLAGAIRPAALTRQKPQRQAVTIPGLVRVAGQPACWRLDIAKLRPMQRRELLEALAGFPISHVLERRLPEGPSFEERPDIKASMEPAPPHNEVDARMIELTRGVIDYWREHDELLTLDETGIGLIAAGLCSEARDLDDDDVEACGAFIGEALRKHAGGEWTGFDEDYRLIIGGESLDPIGWARELHARKDAVAGTLRLAEQIQRVMERHWPNSTWRSTPSEKSANTVNEVLVALTALPSDAPMDALVAEARGLAFRLRTHEWPSLLNSARPLLDSGWMRPVCALAVYAPGEALALIWPQWGRKRFLELGLDAVLADAAISAVDRDDLEAMPNWTLQPTQRKHNFLAVVRRALTSREWRRVLPLLLRQRCLAGDRAGGAWCLYSYRHFFPDALPLLEWFADMVVSARQTFVRATLHATRAERQLFRPLWAEALRDPAASVVVAALDAVEFNDVRSLRMLVSALTRDSRELVATKAGELIEMWTE